MRIARSGSTTIKLSVPIGTIEIVAKGFPTPKTWMRCKGTELSRIDYPELFGLIGVIYGVGDGITTFNIPRLITDYRDYIIKVNE